MTSKLPLAIALVYIIGSAPAVAAVEQCRFIQDKPEREACYQRQDAALAARRKPKPEATAADTGTGQSLQQMRQDDDAVYKSIHGICRGC